jgi:hypothetical protein
LFLCFFVSLFFCSFICSFDLLFSFVRSFLHFVVLTTRGCAASARRRGLLDQIS